MPATSTASGLRSRREFSPVSAKQGNGPDFVVFGAPCEDEPASELGAAWTKTSKAGKAYLSVKLDSPVLTTPINGALTRQQDGSYALVWNRKEVKAGNYRLKLK